MGEVVEFHFNKTMKRTDEGDYKSVHTEDSPTREFVEYLLRDDPLELLLMREEHPIKENEIAVVEDLELSPEAPKLTTIIEVSSEIAKAELAKPIDIRY